jgi:hypothetical protein
MNVKQRWRDFDSRKRKDSERNLSQCHLICYKNPQGLPRARTRASVVRSRWPTAWAMAHPLICFHVNWIRSVTMINDFIIILKVSFMLTLWGFHGGEMMWTASWPQRTAQTIFMLLKFTSLRYFEDVKRFDKKPNLCYRVIGILKLNGLEQSCTTGGPRATPSPRPIVIRPAKLLICY